LNSTSPTIGERISSEQAEYYDWVYRFAQSLPDETVELDRTAGWPRDAWDRCGQFGLQGLPAPEKYGGSGTDVVTTMLALDALGYGCKDNGLVFSINAHLWTSVVPIWKFGTDEQKERWLHGLCSGSLIGCHAITEPDAGSDAFAMKATATEVSGGFVLNGRKTFITNAPVADVLIIFARTSPGIGPLGITAFIVEGGAEGCFTGREIDKMGLRTSPMSEVILDDCFVPAGALLGRRGRGGDVFTESMRWERACIMASQVGAMRRVMESCIDYAKQRKQFGKPIAQFESIADKIADMKISVDASRALIMRVGWVMDDGRDSMLEAAVAKAFVSEANVKVHLDALQIHGGYGYTREFEIERALRDAIGGKIYSGTSEIQRRIIARGLGL
jgi:alkylation response protein AidB-like acyl-CoA dehydrogenase